MNPSARPSPRRGTGGGALRAALALLAALATTGCAVQPLPPAAPPSAAAPAPTGAGAATPATPVPGSFAELPGWAADDLRDAWGAWQRDCQAAPASLAAACAASRQVSADPAARRAFFEHWFRPWRPPAPDGLITGYFEPVYAGSTTRGWPYVVPVWGAPDGLVPRSGDDGVTRGIATSGGVRACWSRAQIDADPTARAVLDRHVVVWLEDPVDALFLQVQGSGLVRLPDGALLRLSYAGDNGWPYASVGRWLLDHGEVRGTVTMQIIRAWARMHPDRVPDMLAADPRVVFFRAAPLVGDAARGPVGALGVPLTPLRSVAVDRRLVPLGSPMWLATRAGGQDLQRLVFAQDVGGAITGPQRADLFFGTGDDAGDAAGRMQSPGRFWILVPRQPGDVDAPQASAFPSRSGAPAPGS